MRASDERAGGGEMTGDRATTGGREVTGSRETTGGQATTGGPEATGDQEMTGGPEATGGREMTTGQAVRSMLLLMPRLVGRAKRLPVPDALRELDLAPRHLALLAYLQYDGPLTVSQLAVSLEVAPTTVSLMVGDLSRRGVLTRAEDDADRRRRIVAIAPGYADAITQWLSGSAAAWSRVLAALTPAERATVVATMRAYEAALDGHAGT